MAYAGDDLDQAQETLPLEALLRRYVGDGIRQLRIAFPGAIAAVTAEQTVDVQPLLKVRYAGQPPSAMPQIRGVPVVMPRGAAFRIAYPVQVGDTGLVLVADRSLDAWLAGDGSAADPNDTRAHDLADAVFIPGLVPDGGQTLDTGSDLVLGNGQLTLRLQPDGHIKVNNAAHELIDVLHRSTQAFIDTLSALAQAQVLTALGPAPFIASSIAQLTQLQARATGILADLDTFKG